MAIATGYKMPSIIVYFYKYVQSLYISAFSIYWVPVCIRGKNDVRVDHFFLSWRYVIEVGDKSYHDPSGYARCDSDPKTDFVVPKEVEFAAGHYALRLFGDDYVGGRSSYGEIAADRSYEADHRPGESLGAFIKHLDIWHGQLVTIMHR